MNEFIREGSEMKTGRLLVLLALVMGLMAGPWQAPAEAIMLGRVGQIKYLEYTGGSWTQVLPDGSTSTFTLRPGQSFVMTDIRAQFYVIDPAIDTGPYRLFFVLPNSTIMYIANLTDFKYPGFDTVWGGTISESNLEPGVVFGVLPDVIVKQVPKPVMNPNYGPVRNGTFYMTIRGYVYP
jgi:hypothetical protein